MGLFHRKNKDFWSISNIIKRTIVQLSILANVLMGINHLESKATKNAFNQLPRAQQHQILDVYQAGKLSEKEIKRNLKTLNFCLNDLARINEGMERLSKQYETYKKAFEEYNSYTSQKDYMVLAGISGRFFNEAAMYREIINRTIEGVYSLNPEVIDNTKMMNDLREVQAKLGDLVRNMQKMRDSVK